MSKFPVCIAPCPIHEAVFEVRFSSIFPSEAVFGIIYQAISKHFADATPIQLPILQLPEAVRQADPNLIFQPLHRLQKKNLSISIGPRVITFSNQAPYIGWEKWKAHILQVLDDLVKAGVCHNFDRAGLRYVNLIQQQLFDVTNVEINLFDEALASQSTTLRTEIKRDVESIVLQLSNNVNINTNNNTFIGSAIDIDVLSVLNLDNQAFGKNIQEILESSHNREKELFFNLLKSEYLSTLSPQYRD